MSKEHEIRELMAELNTFADLTEYAFAEILYEALQIRPLNPFISPAQLMRWAYYDYRKRTRAVPVPDSKDRSDSTQH